MHHGRKVGGWPSADAQMRSLLKLLAFALALPVAAVAVYWTIARVMVLFPHSGEDADSDDPISAFVASNGVHAEFVLPVASSLIDWRTLFPLNHFSAPPERPAFVAIGWGEREFYLNTPTWADLTVPRAIKALFGQNASVVHATYLDTIAVYPKTYRLTLSLPAYARLVNYIRGTLVVRDGHTVPISGAGYGDNDAFFAARGGYDLVTTCNSWVGRGLQAADVKVSRWTPFDWTATWHLEPVW